MARLCPSCGRPNSDAATRCLYCVAALTLAEGGSSEPAPVEELPPVPSDRHLLILLPGNAADEETLAEFSRITGASPYDARLSLSSRRARLFRRIDSEPLARRLSEELSRARVAHYSVAESSVVSLPIVNAFGLDFRDSRLEVHLRDAVRPPRGYGAPGRSPEGVGRSVLSLAHEELLLLVRGEITRELHDENKLGSTRGSSRRLTPGVRLHLYQREASMAVEIDPERFDFGFLQGEQTSSALVNVEKLVSRLTGNPHLSVDRGFAQEAPLLSRSGAQLATDALSESSRGPEGVVYDDEAHFGFYSRWTYRVARHLSKRGA